MVKPKLADWFVAAGAALVVVVVLRPTQGSDTYPPSAANMFGWGAPSPEDGLALGAAAATFVAVLLMAWLARLLLARGGRRVSRSKVRHL